MLSKRIIPCLDVRDGRTTKGVRFKDNVDIGDPVAMARFYYEEGADEIVFYDITASHERRGIMIDVVRRVAQTIFIPFSVGGGIRTLEDMREVLLAGAEKVAVGIGVGVDYGIYLLSRMEEEFRNTRGDWHTMTHTALNSAGRGVVITAVTIIFPILLWPAISELRFNAEMGLLMSFLMFFDMLGALFFVPAAINWLKPKFMKRHAHLDKLDAES